MVWTRCCDYCGKNDAEMMSPRSGSLIWMTGHPIPSGSGTVCRGAACKECAERWQQQSSAWATVPSKLVGKCPDCGAAIYGPDARPDGMAFMSGDGYFVAQRTIYSCSCRFKPSLGLKDLEDIKRIVNQLDEQLKGIQRIEIKPLNESKNWWQRMFGGNAK